MSNDEKDEVGDQDDNNNVNDGNDNECNNERECGNGDEDKIMSTTTHRVLSIVEAL